MVKSFFIHKGIFIFIFWFLNRMYDSYYVYYIRHYFSLSSGDEKMTHQDFRKDGVFRKAENLFS